MSLLLCKSRDKSLATKPNNYEKKLILLAFLLLFAAGCSDMADVEPTVDSDALTEANAPDQDLQGENLRIQNVENNGLNNIKVVGKLLDNEKNAGAFVGEVSITSFSYDEEKGLLASGNLEGFITSKGGERIPVNKDFEDIETTLGHSAIDKIPAANERIAAECQILFLDIGPIFLDVLGLQVDLSQIVLDITAVSGSGNLLGNLLCAVAGLLDPVSGLLELIEFLGDLIELLDLINDLLGGL